MKKKLHAFFVKNVSIPYINVLPQLRKTFDGIDELAIDIKEKGLIHPIAIAIFRKEDCIKYVGIINKLWKNKIKITDLKTYRKTYFVLLSGERRLRACKKNEMKKIRATLYKDILAIDALMLQASENTYVPPKPEEMASFYDKFYQLLVLSGRKMSKIKFAQSVGRSSDAIRNALRFSKLPKKIRKFVDDGVISYGIACEIARLHQEGMKVRELNDWCINAIVKNINGKEFRKIVSKYLLQRKSSQTSFFDIIDILSKEDLEKNLRKRNIEHKTSDAFYAGSKYFLRVLYLFEHSLLGLEESPFSMRGSINAFLNEIEIIEKVIPHMRKVLKAFLIKRGEKAILKSKSLVHEIQAHIN